MCTDISFSIAVDGAGKGADGWFRVREAAVAFDHPSYAPDDHALLIDFTNREADVSSRVAVELDLASGRALLDALARTIESAEASGVAA